MRTNKINSACERQVIFFRTRAPLLTLISRVGKFHDWLVIFQRKNYIQQHLFDTMMARKGHELVCNFKAV